MTSERAPSASPTRVATESPASTPRHRTASSQRALTTRTLAGPANAGEARGQRARYPRRVQRPPSHGPTTARVVTNETCNQNCAFCDARRPVEEPARVRSEAVLSRIDEALASGAREVVLTGGEPTLRRDLPLLVARAKQPRPGHEAPAVVVLETNAALVTPARAVALARAGLDRARVHVPLWGDDGDAITRDPGGARRTLAGLEALAAAGVALELSAPVVRQNELGLPLLPGALALAKIDVSALILAVPTHGPEPEALLPLRRAAGVIERVERAARATGLRVRLAPGAELPPCSFAHPPRVAHLFSLTRGGARRDDRVKLEACEGCAVADRCPGVPRAALAREPELPSEVRPIADERTRRRLSLAGTVDEQIARELVTRDVRRVSDGSVLAEHIVRVSFHCNQSCRFCFVSTHLPPAAEAAVVGAIREIAEAGGVLTLSGGEPTLNPRLVEYVRLGKRLGAREIELQTNATRLAEGGLAAALAEAGVDTAFVSLHAPSAELSDRITEAEGTFDKTVRGLDALAETSIRTRLNFVFCEANQATFPEYVGWCAARWPRAELTVSFVAPSTDVVPRETSLIPRYTDVMPYLAEGIRRARELGVVLVGFESMCGVPLCLVPDDVTRYLAFSPLPKGYDRGEFVKTDACRACALVERCHGLRRGYAELHGTSELRPVPRPSAAHPSDARPRDASTSGALAEGGAECEPGALRDG